MNAGSEGLTVFGLPESHRRKLRMTILIERLNEEIWRRPHVAKLYPKEVACLRFMSAILMEIFEAWKGAGKRYALFNNDNAVEE